jgi:hypothetical protein
VLTNGNLYHVSGSHQTLIDSGVRLFALASSGRLYVLQTNGILLGSSGGLPGQFQQLSTGAKQFALASSGSVYVVQSSGALIGSSDGLPGDFSPLATAVKSVAVDSTGRVFALQSSGVLLTSPAGRPGSFSMSDELVSAIKEAVNGSVVVADWFNQHLPDQGLMALVRQDFIADNSISRGDMLGLFAEAEANGTISGAELQSLRAVASSPGVLHVPGYVRNLAYKAVYGNPADAAFQSHGLAQLRGGGSAVVLEDLVDKWFLGQDHPAAESKYSAVDGTLFGVSGPQYSDIIQGDIGDCWVLASLAETATRNPAEITSMFVVNGDGTWSVRFYHNGSPDWVTVDNQLPGGGATYDNPQNGVLWVALAEKAFAQENASGWLATALPGRNSYNALDGGDPADALTAVTGHVAQDNYVTGSAMAAAWKHGNLIVLTSVNNPPDHSIVGYHAYSVVNYEAATDTYTLFNPWGVDGGYNGTSFYPGFITIKGSRLAANFDGFTSGN